MDSGKLVNSIAPQEGSVFLGMCNTSPASVVSAVYTGDNVYVIMVRALTLGSRCMIKFIQLGISALIQYANVYININGFQKQKKKEEWDFSTASSLKDFQTTALHIAHLEQVFYHIIQPACYSTCTLCTFYPVHMINLMQGSEKSVLYMY